MRHPLSNFCFTLLLLLCAPVSPLQADAPAATPERIIVLKAAHLFDSVSGKLMDHGVVVVTGAKITAVSATASSISTAAASDPLVRPQTHA